MLIESAPGLVNWQQYNKLRRPGIQRLASLQAVACGSDSVGYFQWRKSRGSYEQHHDAVIDHSGTCDTRIFRETKQTGADLKKLASVAGSLTKSKTALIFDWDNRWAIQDAKALSDLTKKYEDTCIDIYKAFLKMGVDMDIVPSDGDLGAYRVVVAPMLYLLQKHTASNLLSFVKNEGQLLATYFTGYVDENTLCYLGDFPGDGMSELFGVVSEEIDTLYPKDKNAILFKSGESWEVFDYAEVLRVNDAEILGSYTEDFYGGMPAVTKKKYPGNGAAYYVAARASAIQMSGLLRKMLVDAGLKVIDLPEGIEYHERKSEDATYAFYLNDSTFPRELRVENGMDLISGQKVSGEIILEPAGVSVIRHEKK